MKCQAVGGPFSPSYTSFIWELGCANNKDLQNWPTFPNHCFWSKRVLSLFYCRQYLETRSLNQRLNSWEERNLNMTYEEDSREGICKDRDRDWHHYSKSSGRSGRSHHSKRSSRRHRERDRRHRRSHSRHRSPSVWEPPSPLQTPPPVYTTKSNGSLSLVFS